ncbi:hydroxyacid dehydrogenase [Acetobacteraceae bacterium H6797]|nr:hydroxyacid dehydrogenase [Acetobacteraceae bacterium H6797]
MPRQVLVPDPIHVDGLAMLAEAPGVVLHAPGAVTPESLPGLVAEAEAMIVRGTVIDQAFLDRAPKLRFVCRHGVGYDNIDVPALTARGVLLAVTPEANASSVAEHTMMLMLTLARQVVPFNAGVRKGEWRVPSQAASFDLGGKTVLIVGFGRIGTRVSKLCQAFGMKVLVTDPHVPRNTIRGLGCEPVTLGEGLEAADIVTLHLPSNAETRNMVDKAFLAGMKQGALLINAARGTLVVEADLEAALKSGHIAGAGLDVVQEEPMLTPIPLLSLPNVVMTPHVAASTAQGLQRMAVNSAKNVLDFFEGRLDRDAIINPEALRLNY